MPDTVESSTAVRLAIQIVTTRPSLFAHDLYIRPIERKDLPIFYGQQSDPEANRLAVATARDVTTFDTHWHGVLNDPHVTACAIVGGGKVLGQISRFSRDGRDMVGYWIGREYWGQGVATRALALLLVQVQKRPLYATTARSNVASSRVLERNAFVLTGYHWADATERFPACEEALFELA